MLDEPVVPKMTCYSLPRWL